MKYVISDKGEVNIGNGFHFQLSKDFTGKVVAAGHCKKTENGYEVYGESIGYSIKSKSEDSLMLSSFTK